MNARRTDILTVLTVLFCVSLVVSNIVAGKLYAAPFGLILPAAVWLFPIVYIVGDIVPEVYGLGMARRMIWLGFAANLFVVLFFWLTLVLPAPAFWKNQAAFEIVLGLTPRLLLASLCAYFIGTNANALVLVIIKKLTCGRWLWMRTIGSTLVGETIDSAVFILIAFAGLVPASVLLGMVMAQAGFKILYEVIATPLTYWSVGFIKSIEYANH